MNRNINTNSLRGLIPTFDLAVMLIMLFSFLIGSNNGAMDIQLAGASGGVEVKVGPVVSIDHTGSVFWDDVKLRSFDQLKLLAQAGVKETPTGLFYLKADRRVDYGTCITVLDILKQAGAVNISLVIEPENAS